ncbi:MAG: hypothetical protein DSM106950_19370 [Stigonema ocellatum SAG 48.90 = DSM 106950]|nr:hypothetical protein [Stigonema ocellatum SAG 48.90 = DSM 106950]
MKRLLPIILIFCFILHTTSVYAAPISQGLDYIAPNCADINEDVFRVELNRQVENFIKNEATKTNIRSLIEEKWSNLSINSAIDSEVDKAVDRVKSNTGYWGRFISNWRPGKAKALAQEVIELVFDTSPVVQGKFQELTETVAEDFSTKLETISVKSSTYAMECLQQFIGGQYSQPVVEIFSENLESSIKSTDGESTNLKPESLLFLKSHKLAIGGAAYLFIRNTIAKKLVDQVISRVVQQVGERIAGRIAESVIPIVDIVMLFQTIGDFANPNAALNEIQISLKKPEVKEKIKEQITDSIQKQLDAQSSAIGIQISSALYSQWQGAKDRFREALNFSKESPEFLKLLEANPAKASLLLETLLENMSRNELRESLQSGTFKQAFFLPESTYPILNRPNGLPLLLEWSNLAGRKIGDVVKLEIYKHKSPKDLDSQLLSDILSVNDPSTVSKLSLLDVNSIRKLLSVSKRNLISVSVHLSPEDLQKLAGYLGELDQLRANQLLKLLNDDPSVIKNPNVVKHILESQDISAALEFRKTPKSLLSVVRDTLGTFTGVVSLKLFLDKYGIPMNFFFIGVPLLFLLAVAVVMWFYRKWLEIVKLQISLDNSDANKSGSSTEPGN